jgi:cytochrome c-type biogenesis protein CcmF
LVGLCAVIFWGTFFPLISEAVTGERSSLGGAWFDRYTAPLAIVLVLFTGIGPLLAWRQVSAGSLWRLVRWPLAATAVATLALVALADAESEPLALALFCFAFFALAALIGEFVRAAAARRALSGGSWFGALATAVARNRRRYGGYTVHAGVALLFIAVAASSSFQTSSDVRLRPGDSATVGDYQVTYERPTTSIDPAEERLTFGAVLDVDRDGEQFAVLEPERNYYASTAAMGSGPVRSFFEGEATSEVGRREGVGGDLWTAMRPDLEPLDGLIAGADRRLMRLARDSDPAETGAQQQLSYLQGLAIRSIAERYEADASPIDLRVNVNPFVIWIWLGGGIAIGGALFALWPVPAGRRRQVSDVYAARLARDLGRA